MSVTQLKIKIKSLAAEAAIIRHEERKYLDRRPGTEWFKLNYHRRVEIRSEARHAALAYGYLRGRALKQIEGKAHTAPDWMTVTRMVRRFGPLHAEDGVKAWHELEPAQKVAA